MAVGSSSFQLCCMDIQSLPGSLKQVVNFAEQNGPGFPLMVREAAVCQVWSQAAWVRSQFCQFPAVQRWLPFLDL